MTALTFTATDSTSIDVATALAEFDREAAEAARQYADAATSTHAAAVVVAAALPDEFRTIGGADAAHVLSIIAEHAADAEQAAHHIESGAREYAEQFDNLASSAKYDAQSAARFFDYLAAGLLAAVA